MYRHQSYKSTEQSEKKRINYFLMSACLETLVKAVWPLSQRPPENVWKYWAHLGFKIRQQYSGLCTLLYGLSNISTHCDLVTPYGNKDLRQHWLRQWLDAWRHQAITWTNADLSSVEFCGIHLTTILLVALKVSIPEMGSKIIFLKLQPHLPGANELTARFLFSQCSLDAAANGSTSSAAVNITGSGCPYGWEYDTSVYTSTVVTEVRK